MNLARLNKIRAALAVKRRGWYSPVPLLGGMRQEPDGSWVILKNIEKVTQHSHKPFPVPTLAHADESSTQRGRAKGEFIPSDNQIIEDEKVPPIGGTTLTREKAAELVGVRTMERATQVSRRGSDNLKAGQVAPLEMPHDIPPIPPLPVPNYRVWDIPDPGSDVHLP